MELRWIENWTAKDVLWLVGDCPCISFQLLCPKHCLCCEVARLAAVLQLAKTTWAPWSFISHGIYDPKIDSRNALPLNVFLKGIYWIVSSRFFKIFLCGRHKVQSLPMGCCFAIHRKKSGLSRFLKHPRILAFMYRTSESCRLTKRPSWKPMLRRWFVGPKMWTSHECLSYRHFNLPAQYGFFGCCAFKTDRLQPTNFSEDTPTRRLHLPADRRHFPGTASLLTKS